MGAARIHYSFLDAGDGAMAADFGLHRGLCVQQLAVYSIAARLLACAHPSPAPPSNSANLQLASPAT